MYVVYAQDSCDTQKESDGKYRCEDDLLADGDLQAPKEDDRKECGYEVLEDADDAGCQQVCPFVVAVIGMRGDPGGRKFIPECRYWITEKDEGEDERDHVGDDKGYRSPDEVEERAGEGVGGKPSVEEENRDFDETRSEDVEDLIGKGNLQIVSAWTRFLRPVIVQTLR